MLWQIFLSYARAGTVEKRPYIGRGPHGVKRITYAY